MSKDVVNEWLISKEDFDELCRKYKIKSEYQSHFIEALEKAHYEFFVHTYILKDEQRLGELSEMKILRGHLKKVIELVECSSNIKRLRLANKPDRKGLVVNANAPWFAFKKAAAPLLEAIERACKIDGRKLNGKFIEKEGIENAALILLNFLQEIGISTSLWRKSNLKYSIAVEFLFDCFIYLEIGKKNKKGELNEITLSYIEKNITYPPLIPKNYSH